MLKWPKSANIIKGDITQQHITQMTICCSVMWVMMTFISPEAAAQQPKSNQIPKYTETNNS